MTEEKKQGFFDKLFGGCGRSCCCNVRIEEATASEPEKPENKQDDERIPNDAGKASAGPDSGRTGDDNSGHRA